MFRLFHRGGEKLYTPQRSRTPLIYLGHVVSTENVAEFMCYLIAMRSQNDVRAGRCYYRPTGRIRKRLRKDNLFTWLNALGIVSGVAYGFGVPLVEWMWLVPALLGTYLAIWLYKATVLKSPEAAVNSFSRYISATSWTSGSLVKKGKTIEVSLTRGKDLIMFSITMSKPDSFTMFVPTRLGRKATYEALKEDFIELSNDPRFTLPENYRVEFTSSR